MLVDRVPPAVDGSESCSQSLAERFHGGSSDIITLSGDMELAVRGIRQLEEQKKDLEQELNRLKNEVKASMGDVETAVFGDDREGGRVTWKPTAGRVTVDAKRLKAELPEVFKKYSKTTKPSRVFRIKWEEN